MLSDTLVQRFTNFVVLIKLTELLIVKSLKFHRPYDNLFYHPGGWKMKKTLIIATISFFLGMVIAGLIFIYSPEQNYPDNFADTQPSSSLSSNLYASPTAQSREDLDFVTIAERAAPARHPQRRGDP